MPPVSGILSVLRAAAVWLLMVSVLFGPAGLGSIGVTACEVSCPCDEPEPCPEEEGEEDPHEHDSESPDDDEGCLEDCSCCAPGVTLATAAVLVTACSASSPLLVLAPADDPTAGVRTGVFRPPRSLV